MTDHGRSLEFGISVVPSSGSVEQTRALVLAADAGGMDLVGIQDHPYQRRFLDTFTLIASLLAQTESVRIFPDVANLPLRPPAMLAKEAASLDVLSGGRFELGLGAGAFWDAIEAMGGPRRSPSEAVEALGESIEIIRRAWRGERSVRFQGKHYGVSGYHAGPPPAHDIEIWIGAYRPRMLRLIGRLADGWLPSLGRISVDDLAAGQTLIDEAAGSAGRDPSQVRRLLNVSGTIGRDGDPSAAIVGGLDDWVETVSGLATELGVDTFILWPADPAEPQVESWMREVVPRVRTEVERRSSLG
jgi:alkanesulfonate monooxygenase SsuD/methylene tetrahydromethanopterin reductase-like flavin-dependent oxidoreductase (luciferase family)